MEQKLWSSAATPQTKTKSGGSCGGVCGIVVVGGGGGGTGGGGHAFQTESIKARKDSTSNGKIPNLQSLTLGHYRHPVSGQSYRHPVSGQSFRHLISGQSYRHPVSGQSYRHPISGQSYRHPISGQSYRHPISRQRSTCRFQLTKLATAEGEKSIHKQVRNAQTADNVAL